MQQNRFGPWRAADDSAFCWRWDLSKNLVVFSVDEAHTGDFCGKSRLAIDFLPAGYYTVI